MATPAPLYLDAARLGAMSPTAQLAARDFARLAGEGLSTLYWEEFLRGQFSGASRSPGLAHWRGMAGVGEGVRRVLAAPRDAPVLFASRTAALTQTAVEFLASRSRRIFTTDALWPPYRCRLDEACRRHGSTVWALPVRHALLSSRWSKGELVQRMVQSFAESRCDAAFVSSVSHDGIRLPLTTLMPPLREHNPRTFIVIDGAQEFAHVPVRLAAAAPDVYIAGCHKWLGAYQPLGLGVLANPRTATLLELEFAAQLDDPLFDYVKGLAGRVAPRPTETVNLTPLICASGALADFLRHDQRHHFRQQRSNALQAAGMAEYCGWRPGRLPPGLRTGILLLRSRAGRQAAVTADDLQREFDAAGVIVTAYAGDTVRLSFPGRPLHPAEWGRLHAALRSAGMAPLRTGCGARGGCAKRSEDSDHRAPA